MEISTHETSRGGYGRHTEQDAVYTVRFLQEAVDLPHLSQGVLGPTVGGDDRLNLFAQRSNVLGHGSQVVEGMRHTLQSNVRRNRRLGILRTHVSRGVNSTEVDEENPHNDAEVVVALLDSVIKDPLNRVILMKRAEEIAYGKKG